MPDGRKQLPAASARDDGRDQDERKTSAMSASLIRNSHVLLGVSGGIAAYKSAELCRRLMKRGACVRVIMTKAATQFVAPLTFETLTRQPVYVDMFDRDRAFEIEHVSFARWGDALVIAPATANAIAKLAAGLADDPLSTTALAFRGPLVVAPAMNAAMWEHPQTQENVARLRERGAAIVEPESGQLACGEEGAGRLAELDRIEEAVEAALRSAAKHGPLAGRRVLVTAGPTAEPIDPVRHLSNPSTGRMGFAMAAEARRRGASVTLIAGPTLLDPPEGLKELVRVRTAREMRDAVMDRLAAQDVCVFAAAVADYAPESTAEAKIKKEESGQSISLKLVRTPDVAAEANAARRPGQVLVGFAAETSDLAARAREKMERKGFDVVVANEVSSENPAFAAPENAVTLLARSGVEERLPRARKEDLAVSIWDFVLQRCSMSSG